MVRLIRVFPRRTKAMPCFIATMGPATTVREVPYNQETITKGI